MHITEAEYRTLVKNGLLPARETQPSLGSSHVSEDGRTIFVTLFLAAIGKPRMTQADKWKQRPCVMRYRAWCDALREVAGTLPEAKSVASLNWTAYFEPPESWPKKRRIAAIGALHRQKPDKDNLEKAIFDCLFPGEDQAIADGRGTKKWAWVPRLEIEIFVEV